MPGMLLHLAFAKEVYEVLKSKVDISYDKFIEGNLLPDLTKDKKLSHYRVDASQKGLCVPNLKLVEKELFVLNDSVKLGMFCHLFLDYNFIERILIPSFNWDFVNMKVINIRNNKSWKMADFFSRHGLYFAYREFNPILVSEGKIPTEVVDRIPDNFEKVGIPYFDDRLEKSWREEYNRYINMKPSYTGEVLEYETVWKEIERIKEILIEFFDRVIT